MYWTPSKMLVLADVDEYSFENAALLFGTLWKPLKAFTDGPASRKLLLIGIIQQVNLNVKKKYDEMKLLKQLLWFIDNFRQFKYWFFSTAFVHIVSKNSYMADTTHHLQYLHLYLVYLHKSMVCFSRTSTYWICQIRLSTASGIPNEMHHQKNIQWVEQFQFPLYL